MSRFSAEEAMLQLSSASTQLHPDDIIDVVRAAGAGIGLSDIVVYLVDLDQRTLVPLPSPRPGQGNGVLPALSVDGTIAGRAYRTERTVIVPRGEEAGGSGRSALWFALLDSAERLGVVHATTDAATIDQAQIHRWEAYTGLVGEVIANKAAYGDVLTTIRRTRPLALAAEMRWSLLPPLTFTGRNLTISGIVMPAYEIAGDTFDYAVNGNTGHVAILDAVGHGLESARIATVAVSAYRNGRRAGHETVEIYRLMDETIVREFGHAKFVTAQLATLDLASGLLKWLNAGHPPPMVIRRGHRVDLESAPWLPVGLSGPSGSLTETWLEPEDIVLFFTDGITEARSAGGNEFGRERLADFVERAVAGNHTPAETLRLLSIAVLGHQKQVLQDDATLLLVVWSGPPGT